MTQRVPGSPVGVLLAALLSATSPVDAQEPDAVAARDAWRQLAPQLVPGTEDGTAPRPRHERRALLERYLDRFDVAALRREAPVLDARLAYATLLLTGFEARRARDVFAGLLDDTVPDDVARRARAEYGLAQAIELAGELEDAAERYRRIADRFAGTRYGDWAAAAARRLDRNGGHRPRAGDVATEFGPRRDVDDRSISLASLGDAPTVLLFWSPDDPRGMDRLDLVVQNALAAGLEPDQLVGFAVAADAERARKAAQERGWNFAQIACPAPFLDDALFAYGATGTPTWVLLDHRRRFLAWDLPPDRLRGILRTLLER